VEAQMNIDPAILLGLRPRMMSVAYRMLGSVTDAEDAVQDAFVRLQAAEKVRSPEGFLIRTTTRLCIDRLRGARRRKEYVGPWVPEPVATKGGARDAALAESLAQAFLLMLERLSPDERAAFLLRTVFDYEFAEIAEVLGKSEVHVRQIVSRARHRLGNDEARFRPAPRVADGLAERFVAACRAGDVRSIEEMLTEDVEVLSDGGGKVSAARTVITGRDRAAPFLAGVFSKKRRDCEMRVTTVNGEPGVVFTSGGAVIHVVSLRIEGGVRAVYMTLNPDKLSRWSVAEVE
jgi:RNA polymerase sigma-70 factor (ECF subfamily)